MKVLFASSEALPFMASGGLGDVAGSLPHALRKRLIGCRVVMPMYDTIRQELKDKMKTAGFSSEAQTIADTASHSVSGGSISEAIAALLALGYSQSEAAQAVAGCSDEESVDTIIKQGLKKLSGGRW